MIRQLRIDITVYHYYPFLAILVHNHLSIDALLESEMRKQYFSYSAQPPQIQNMIHSLSICWVSLYSKQKNGCLLNKYLTKKTISISFIHSLE